MKLNLAGHPVEEVMTWVLFVLAVYEPFSFGRESIIMEFGFSRLGLFVIVGL